MYFNLLAGCLVRGAKIVRILVGLVAMPAITPQAAPCTGKASPLLMATAALLGRR